MQFKALNDHVYDYISDHITNGTIKPNEKINEKQIAKDLSISSTPVREALIKLEALGYVTKIPRKGFYVNNLTLKQVKEKYAVIGVLDSLAASLAFEYITDADIKKMGDIVKKIDIAIKKIDFKIYFELQTEFHDIYINKCNNDELINELYRLKNSFIKKTYFINNDESKISTCEVLKASNKDHLKIIDFFKTKNKEGLLDFIKNVHWSVKYAKYDSF